MFLLYKFGVMVYQEGQKYGSTRKNTGLPVNLRVDPYFCGSTRKYTGRPLFLRVDP